MNRTEPNIIYNPFVMSVFCLLYSVIFVTGCIGNSMVMYAVFRNKNMHSVTNFLIANLAISDILMSVFAVTLSPLYTFLEKWVFGEILCHLLPFIQATSVYISTLTLMTIAVERYYVIVHPFKSRMRLKNCRTCLLVMWILASILTCPYAINMRHFKEENYYYCEEKWTKNIKNLFAFSTTTIQFLTPFTVMTFCYIKVFQQLRIRAKSRLSSTKCSQKEEADRERKRKVNRVLISMVLIFAVCWMPLTCLNLIDDVDNTFLAGDYLQVIFMSSHVIAMSSTCYNPFLYAWMNENFRREFKSITPCTVGKNNKVRRISTTNTTFHETAVTTYSTQQQQQQCPSVVNDGKIILLEEIPLQPLSTVQEMSSECNSEETAKIQISDNTKREWL